MRLFGYKLVKAEEYEKLKLSSIKWQKTVHALAWFSGWEDMEILRKYLVEDTNFGGIERARSDYARARGTDEYGRKEGARK